MKVSAVLITREKEYPKEIDQVEMAQFFDEVLYRTECPSIYDRYLTAMKAKNDVIYVQDDDAIVDYKELFTYYNGSLTNCMTQGHFNAYRDSGATLVGWGCYFPKSALDRFSKYIEAYGEDDHLWREADRIFTVLNQPHNTIIRDHTDTIPQINRMWQEGNHWTSMAEAIRKTKLLI